MLIVKFITGRIHLFKRTVLVDISSMSWGSSLLGRMKAWFFVTFNFTLFKGGCESIFQALKINPTKTKMTWELYSTLPWSNHFLHLCIIFSKWIKWQNLKAWKSEFYKTSRLKQYYTVIECCTWFLGCVVAL
jgi:hypothetical protein